MFFNTNPLFNMPIGIETKWASPENVDGKKGAAGKSYNGRKGCFNINLKNGEQKYLLILEIVVVLLTESG